MGASPVQSQVQGDVSSSPRIGLKPDLLGFTSPWSLMPTIPLNAELVKDGRKLLLRLARDNDSVATWLGVHTGLTVTVAIPHLGLAWSSTLSYRRSQHYFYVRVPANLKKYLLPFWQSNIMIPVVITIPPIAWATRSIERVSQGGQ